MRGRDFSLRARLKQSWFTKAVVDIYKRVSNMSVKSMARWFQPLHIPLVMSQRLLSTVELPQTG